MFFCGGQIWHTQASQLLFFFGADLNGIWSMFPFSHVLLFAEEWWGLGCWLDNFLTYGPRKAAAEVSNHKEPIGRGCVALVRKSIDVGLTRVADQVAWLRTDLDCHLIWGLFVHRSFRFKWIGCQLLWDWSDLFVKRFEMAVDLKFQGFGCQRIWNSKGWVVNWFEIQTAGLSSDVWLNWFCVSMLWDSNGLVIN